MSNQTSFSIPRERGEQLRTLAHHGRTSVSAMVGEWIDRSLGETGLDPTIPGIEFVQTPCALEFGAPGFQMTFTTAEDGLHAADGLERAARRGIPWMLVAGGNSFEISRKGTGVVCKLTDAVGKISSHCFAPNVALTVSKQLRVAARKIVDTWPALALGDLEEGT